MLNIDKKKYTKIHTYTKQDSGLGFQDRRNKRYEYSRNY